MGIRVHKALGYGVDTIRVRKYQSDDPRLNEAILYKLREEYDDLDQGKLMKKLQDAKKDIIELHQIFNNSVLNKTEEIGVFDFTWMMKAMYDQTDPEMPSDLLHWDTEFGIGEVMLFRPFSHKNWLRYDDPIDHQEESRNRCETLDTPIYPWSWWTKIREPERKLEGSYKSYCRDSDMQFIDSGDYNQLVGRWDKKSPPLAKKNDLDHFLNDYRPIFPIDVTAMLWLFSPAFKDIVEFGNALRPMIYVYWS